jgi:hypothetical protein
VAGEERIDPGVEEEAQEHPARVAQHHHEGHQRPPGAPDLEVTEVAPLCREPDYAEYRGDSRINRASRVA